VRRLPLLLLVLLAGCVPPPDIDPQVRGELRAAAAATVAAMDLPAAERPSEHALDDSAGLLAIQSPAARQQLIREGRIGRETVLGRARDSMAQLARDRSGLVAPAMLTWLVGHGVDLDTGQLLLTDALTAQLRREAHLDK
jgi:hypothetical protein